MKKVFFLRMTALKAKLLAIATGALLLQSCFPLHRTIILYGSDGKKINQWESVGKFHIKGSTVIFYDFKTKHSMTVTGTVTTETIPGVRNRK